MESLASIEETKNTQEENSDSEIVNELKQVLNDPKTKTPVFIISQEFYKFYNKVLQLLGLMEK